LSCLSCDGCMVHARGHSTLGIGPLSSSILFKVIGRIGSPFAAAERASINAVSFVVCHRPHFACCVACAFQHVAGFPGEGPVMKHEADAGMDWGASPPLFVLQARWEEAHDKLLAAGPGPSPPPPGQESADDEAANQLKYDADILNWASCLQQGVMHNTVTRAPPKLRAGGLVCTVNVTANGSLAACAATLCQSFRLVFVQEHHLLGTARLAALRAYAGSGIKAHLDDAIGTSKLGTSGGVGFI
jgi:hypothetical protein